MTSMTKHTLIDCFSLRARIGWQGLRSDEFKTEGPYLVTGVDFYNGRVDWDNCYHVTEEAMPRIREFSYTSMTF